MVGDFPDENCFNQIIGELVSKATDGKRYGVRAFGEMVALLWADGNANRLSNWKNFGTD